jgi:transcriptional regulator with XRE-family HTH domain
VSFKGGDPSMASQAINPHIGARLRRLRKRLGFSLRHVGRQVGLSHQQIGKYESGKSHIKAETLAALAAVLKTTVEVIVGDIIDNETMHDPETTRLLHAFSKVKSPKSREYLIKVVEDYPKGAE